MGLFDAVLIKNNHIAAAGGVRQAIQSARSTGLPVEIEVRTKAELAEALATGAAHLLLDNPVRFAGPVRLLHGQRDPDVPWQIALKVAAALESYRRGRMPPLMDAH